MNCSASKILCQNGCLKASFHHWIELFEVLLNNVKSLALSPVHPVWHSGSPAPYNGSEAESPFCNDP
jgi:hypothetical protein